MSIFKQQNANAIVVDAGSSITRIGLAQDPCPIFYLENKSVKDSAITEPDELLKQITACEMPVPGADKLPLILTVNKWSGYKKLYDLLDVAFEHFDTVGVIPQEQATVFYSNRASGVFVDVGYNSTRIYGTSDGTFTEIRKIGYDLQKLDNQLYSLLNCQSREELIRQKLRLFAIPDSPQPFLQGVFTDRQGIPAHIRCSFYQPPNILLNALIETVQETQRFSKQQVEVFVAGGGSILPGFCEKLQSHLQNRVVASRDRANHQFLGGATWAGSWSMDVCGFCREDLEEFGEAIFEKQVW